MQTKKLKKNYLLHRARKSNVKFFQRFFHPCIYVDIFCFNGSRIFSIKNLPWQLNNGLKYLRYSRQHK